MEIKYEKLDYNKSINVLLFAYNEMVSNKQIEDNNRNKLMSIKLNLVEVDNDKMWLYGAYNKNKIIGVIGYTTDAINILFVNSKYQRMGIATNLLKFTLEDLKKKNIDKIKLDATNEGYEFYKASGFVETKSDNDKYINMIYTL